MANDLKTFKFTNKADYATSTTGWFVNDGIVVDALGGNDRITGGGSLFNGIINDGTINTGDGNDMITGSCTNGLGIINYGTIDTGTGNDRITGPGGIYTGGTINTGNGNDKITGTSSSVYGISNYYGGAINTGDGNDTITGRADSKSQQVADFGCRPAISSSVVMSCITACIPPRID